MGPMWDEGCPGPPTPHSFVILTPQDSQTPNFLIPTPAHAPALPSEVVQLPLTQVATPTARQSGGGGKVPEEVQPCQAPRPPC